MKPKIVVVGSSNTDMVVRVDTIPKLGETVLGGDFLSVQGGKGANQAVAAARLGADVAFIARLGRDNFGKSAFTAYQTEGINTDYIAWDEKYASGVALILVNKNGENIIAVAPGANSQLSPDDVDKAESVIKNSTVVLVQLEVPLKTVERAVNLAKRYRAKVILNPAPATKLPNAILRKINYLTPNESEFTLLAQNPTGDIISSAKRLISQFHHLSLVITMGAQGVLIINGNIEKQVSGYPVKAIDTVAAGDAFNGALAVALAQGNDLEESVRYANAVGAITVTRAGAQPSLPTARDVIQFIDQI